MWYRKQYIEGLIAKSLYEPLSSRERRQMDKAMASDPSLEGLAGRLETLVEQSPRYSVISTPDLLPDLRLAIAAEDTAPSPRPLWSRRNSFAAATSLGAIAIVGFALWQIPGSIPQPVYAPAASLMQQAMQQSDALIAEHQSGDALRMLETALRAQPDDPDAASARLMFADLAFEENLYPTAQEAYSEVQTKHAEFVLALDESARFRVAERVDLLDECSVDGFESLMAYDAALREADDRFERLERVAARTASDPYGLLAGRVLWSMAEIANESDGLTNAEARVAALERVRNRCSNPVVAARASFEAGQTYEREVGDPVRAMEAYRLAGKQSGYEAAAATAIARLESR